MARKLEVEIVGDASSLQRALRTADSSSSGFGKSLGRLGKAGVLAAGAAGVGALVYTLKTGIGEFMESKKVTAQTRAVIKSTGGAAHITAGQISELAGSIMKKSGIDDEAIQSGENLLLTFTNIRNEVGKGNDIFNQATNVMADMSVALGQDMKSSAIQLGKALNDPIKGVTALQRVGVSFTQAQKDQIKALVSSGHTLDAQKLILKELNKEFGGSAEAMGKTLPGQINILKERFNNFSGELVAKMIPRIQLMIAWLRDHWPEIVAKVQEFWAAIQPTVESLKELFESVVETIRTHWGTIGPIVEDIGRVIKAQLRVIADIIRVFAAVIRGDWGAAWRALKDLVRDALNAIKAELVAVKDAMVAAARALGTAIKNAVVAGVSGVASAVWDVVNNIGSLIRDKLGEVIQWGKNVGASLVSGIVSGLGSLAGKIRDLIRAAVNAVIDRINELLTFHVTIDTHLPKIGKVSFGNDMNIPRLAKGGIVTKPTLAMIGERGPEAVVPLGGGSGRPMQVNVNVDGKTLASVLVDPMRNAISEVEFRSGKSAFARAFS